MINFSEAAWFVALPGDSASRIGGMLFGGGIGLLVPAIRTSRTLRDAVAFIDMRMCKILLAVALFIMLVWVFTKLYYTRKIK